MEGSRQERTRPNRKYKVAISILAFNGGEKPCWSEGNEKTLSPLHSAASQSLPNKVIKKIKIKTVP